MNGFLVCAAECDQCLFGPNRVVTSSRMRELLKETQRKDTYFVCHKSTLAGHNVACAGWHARFDCNLSRIMGRLGGVSFVDPETATAPGTGAPVPGPPTRRTRDEGGYLSAPTEGLSDARAYLSADRVYRYSLTRDVAPLTGEGTVSFIGLNPSTADATMDDPTIRRCMRFARDWGFARLKMLNLYAYRATDPRDLFAFRGDQVGPENDCTIAKVVGGSDLVVCAWGVLAGTRRADQVLGLVVAPHSLGVTKNGAPRHPLYVKASQPPVPFAHCPALAAFAPGCTSPGAPVSETGNGRGAG